MEGRHTPLSYRDHKYNILLLKKSVTEGQILEVVPKARAGCACSRGFLCMENPMKNNAD